MREISNTVRYLYSLVLRQYLKKKKKKKDFLQKHMQKGYHKNFLTI